MQACAIILAGGLGSRFGQKKQFLVVQNKPLWQHVFDKIAKIIPKENICVVGVTVPGGETRSKSVINGLTFLKDRGDYDRLLIVEAARPLITDEQVLNILQNPHSSCTYTLPLKSTIIKKDGTYLNREDLCKLSTPVAFDYHMFSKAYLTGKYLDYTDDTRVMFEEYGEKPFLLEGDENLLKLTYPSDIAIFENLLKRYPL